MSFIDELKKEANLTTTEKGALTHKSSTSRVLDLFALGGALRSRQEGEIQHLVNLAMQEDPLLALKCLFYLRDIRGGQGERRTFRVALKHLATKSPEMIKSNLPNIVKFGRFDDLFTLLQTPLREDVFNLIDSQLREDINSPKPSLMAKWMPSGNTSSKATRDLAKEFQKALKMSPKKYRQTLSALRAKLKVVETFMCRKEFKSINFAGVPSRAAMIYRKAFYKQAPEEYGKFIEQVKKGEKTIKSSTLYPYDIVKAVMQETGIQWDRRSHPRPYSESLDLQWQALPNYVSDANMLVIADVSGSMGSAYGTSTRPIDVALSLAIYTAERNQGPFNNLFLTFTDDAKVVHLSGTNLAEKILSVGTQDWGTTNLQSAFNRILEIAERTAASPEEMPKSLMIVSDMEFDAACRSNSQTNFDAAKKKFNAAGYELPTVIFWNVCSRNNQSPVTKDERGAMLVSGCSPSILEQAMTQTIKTPMELMLEKLNSDRYSSVTV